jgi:hypothetical protein
MGWDVACVTSVRHSVPGAPYEQVDGLDFYRTASH